MRDYGRLCFGPEIWLNAEVRLVLESRSQQTDEAKVEQWNIKIISRGEKNMTSLRIMTNLEPITHMLRNIKS